MSEFERFQKEIDLRQYAAKWGYAIEPRRSSRGSTCMRSGDDKIIISQRPTGEWVFCSNTIEDFKGSIINFCAHMKGLEDCRGKNFRIIADELRAFMGAPPPDLPKFQPLRRTVTDRAAVVEAFDKMPLVGSLPCLTARGITPDILRRPEFSGCVRMDQRVNAIFGHYDKAGVCGYEIKNRGFTGFSSGGIKGLWFSKSMQDMTAAVFAESAVDALSYAALHPNLKARFFSIGGTLNPNQPALIRAALDKLPSGSAVLLAFDNDKGGEKLAAKVQGLVPLSLEVVRALPPEGVNDWNDALRLALGIKEPARPPKKQNQQDLGL